MIKGSSERELQVKCRSEFDFKEAVSVQLWTEGKVNMKKVRGATCTGEWILVHNSV